MAKPVRIIAGLGNPEEKYERTLHNAGFWFVDALARKQGGLFRFEKKFDAECCRIKLHGEDLWLVKPQSYMNHSGPPIRSLLDYYRLQPNELLVNEAGVLTERGKRHGVQGRHEPEKFEDAKSGKRYGFQYGHTIASSWSDLDGDGDLDLWVSNLVHKFVGEGVIQGLAQGPHRPPANSW